MHGCSVCNLNLSIFDFSNLESGRSLQLYRAADLGRFKASMKAYAYYVGKYRIIFTIEYTENTIALHRVCDHKSAYGKD